jgi:hypothetical protein
MSCRVLFVSPESAENPQCWSGVSLGRRYQHMPANISGVSCNKVADDAESAIPDYPRTPYPNTSENAMRRIGYRNIRLDRRKIRVRD